MLFLVCFNLPGIHVTKMAMKINWFYLTCLCFTLSESFSVDNLKKCSINDAECQKETIKSVIQDVAKAGIPELNIPPLDPFALSNVNVKVLDVVNITLVDGVARGIKGCSINSFEVDTEKGIAKQEIMCDFVIKGHYNVHGNSDLLRRLLGNNGGLRGDGKGKVKLEKLVLNMKYNLYPEKHDDGEIYLKGSDTDFEYTYDIKGKASFAADNIYVGKENISEFVVKYLNDNWKYVLKNFGKAFVDKAMEFYFDFTKKFYGGVPAKHFITDDLTPYLKD